MRTRNLIIAMATASFALLSCEQDEPDNPNIEPNPDPEVPVKVVPSVSISVVDSTETSLTFTLTPSDAREVAYQLLEAGAEIPGAEDILSNGTAADTVTADYTVSDLAAGTTYIIAAAARNADTLSDVAHIEAVTKVEVVVPDPVPTVTIESVKPKREGVTFTYTQQDAEDMAYLVVGSSDVIPSAVEILENGTAIDLQNETVTVEGLTSLQDYILAVAARHGEEYSEVANVTFTTLRRYYIDEDVTSLVFTAVEYQELSNSSTDATRLKLTFTNDEGWTFEARVYAYLTADGTTLADGLYSVSNSKEAGNLEPGDVEPGWYLGSFLDQEVGTTSRSDNMYGPLTSGTMTITDGIASFDFIMSGSYAFTGTSEAAIVLSL